MKKIKYIDLFAGIGGFHVALEKLGHECVFASELSVELRNLYEVNFKMTCSGDITKTAVENIPNHDLLCAGFPCQTFSKAGNQKGLNEARGKLFDEIIKILSFHRPKYFILENVRNIITHNNGETWNYIKSKFKDLNYSFDYKIISPHFINIPQHRERVFIIGSSDSHAINNMQWIEKEEYTNSVNTILNHNYSNSDIDNQRNNALDVWQEFVKLIPKHIDIVHPLWSMEYGADYPLDKKWQKMSLNEWKNYKGMYGKSLSGCNTLSEVYENLPNYVRKQPGLPPNWKKNIIQKNRAFFKNNKELITIDIINKIKSLNVESWKKFEWNCNGAKRCLDDKIIQFRGSGVRVKNCNYVPSLVTVSTQIPIIGKYRRYINTNEAAKLQSLPDNIYLPTTNSSAFRTIGNMVNIEIVYRIASKLLQ